MFAQDFLSQYGGAAEGAPQDQAESTRVEGMDWLFWAVVAGVVSLIAGAIGALVAGRFFKDEH